MRKLSKSLLMFLGLGAILLLGGCAGSLPDARPAFGYSGLQDEEGPLSNYDRGKIDFAAARYGLAIDRFRAAMGEDPTSVEAVNGLAASYDQIGRFDLAERYYRRALAMDPNSAQTLNNLGYSLHLQGKHDLAVALFGDAIRRAPEDEIVTANANRAVAALTNVRKQEAAAAEAKTLAAPASQRLAAGQAERRERSRIVRVDTNQQRLELAAPTQPRGREAAVARKMAPGPSAGPAIAPPPLIPVEVELLPAVYRPESDAVAAEPVKALPQVRVAEPISGQDVTVAVDEPEIAAPVDLSGSIEVSNGTGRRFMAARMQDYLTGAGLSVAWLSNADHFSHASTTITYRRGHRELAETLSASLPIAPRLVEVTEQAADVRIELGGDLLEFDHGLLQAERKLSNVDAV